MLDSVKRCRIQEFVVLNIAKSANARNSFPHKKSIIAAAVAASVFPFNARGLTPREAYRMQGMPEWAAHHPTTSHALKHAGNAVAVPVARELGRQLGQILGKRG